MILTRRMLLFVSLLLGIASPALAQATTGLPPLADFTNGPDEINLGNLNIHLIMPIEVKGGRDLSFAYNLSYDSNVWTPVGVSGSQSWVPSANWGFTTGLSAWNGVVSYSSSSNCVQLPPPYSGEYCYGSSSNYAYQDSNSTLHLTTYEYGYSCYDGSCTYDSGGSLTATDDSGYTICLSGGCVTDASGNTINTASTNLGTVGSIEDTNGNYLSANTSGSNYVMTDTLGSTVLTLPKSPSPPQVQFTIPTGTVTIYYSYWTVQTDFGCSGISEYGPTKQLVPFPQSISLPDGTSYAFAYEKTPGNSGNITGRISSISLPSGGFINYTYSGGENGINCADGTTAVLSRYFSADGSTWTYAHTPGAGAASTTTTTDPLNDQTVVNFQGIYATEAQIYEGAASPSNLLQTVLTCYNGTAPSGNPATCNSASIALPIASRTQYVQWPGTTVLESETNVVYNAFGQPTETDQYGYGSGQPSSLIQKTTVSYGTLNRPTSITVANGSGTTAAQTNFTYDSAALTSVTGVAQHDDTNYGTGHTVRGNPTQIQNWIAGSTFLSTSATYDTTGQHISDTDSNGNVTTYSYADRYYTDNGQNPPQSYTPAEPTNALVTAVTGPIIGVSASYGYYFSTGEIALAADQNGATSYSHYDSLGRLTNFYFPASSSGNLGAYPGWTLVQYPSSSEQDFYTGITDTSPSASCTNCRHMQENTDSAGRDSNDVLVNDPDGATTVARSYDELGRLEGLTTPYRGGSSSSADYYGYDALNRLLSTTHQPEGSSLSDYYGLTAVASGGGNTTQLCSSGTYGLGYPVLLVDSSGKKQQSWINALNQIIEADEPDSNGNLTVGTCYSYDALGDVTQITQGSETRSYSYDGLSRVTSEATPETGTTYVYYTTSTGALCSGNPTSICRKTDARGITTTNTYDARNRLTSMSFSDGQTPTTQYFYDQTSYNGVTIYNGKGRSTGMSDGSGTSAYSYDLLGQVVTENHTINGVTKNMTYSYNLDGSVAAIQYPSGRLVQYTYSPAQRPISAWDGGLGVYYATNAHYAPQGFLSYLLLGQVGGSGGLSEEWSYNSRLQMTGVSGTTSGGTTFFNLSYGMPGSGQNNNEIQSVINNLDNGRTMSVTYDTLNRLAAAQSQATSGPDCWGQSYGYDRWANLLTISVTQCTSSGLSLSVTNNKITNSGFTYDAAGNMTADSANNYTYDGASRLSSAAGVAYSYDGRNLRTEKSSGTIYWRGVSGDAFTESDLSGNVTNDYVFFDGTRIARINASSNVYYYFQDKLGSVRTITDGSGNVCYNADFTPFGSEIAFVNTCPQNYKFTGYERDSESGLDYAIFRYYDNRVGRFTSPDPLKGGVTKPQSLNRYTYTLNNPCNLVDPTGTQSCSLVMGGFTDNPNNIDQNMSQFAANIGANMAFPYSALGDGLGGAVADFFASNSKSTNQVASNAIQSTCAGPGSCTLYLISGAAQSFANVYDSLPSNVQSNIGNIVYLSPGLTGFFGSQKLPKGSGQTVMLTGSTPLEGFITDPARLSDNPGVKPQLFPDASCQGHSSKCAFDPQNNLGQYKGAPCDNPQAFTEQVPNGYPIASQELYLELMAMYAQLLQESQDYSQAIIDGWNNNQIACVTTTGPVGTITTCN